MDQRLVSFIAVILVACAATSGAQDAPKPTRFPPVEPAPLAANRLAFRTAHLPEHLALKAAPQNNDTLASAMLPSAAAGVDPIAVDGEISLALLLDEVLARHPSLTSAIAAWRAAAAKYPQAVSLDDPMFDVMLAPGTIGDDELDFAYVLQGRQKIPWPLRGAVAQHEAQALAHEAGDVRRRLIEATQLAYYDYVVVVAALENLNDDNRRAVATFRSNAVTRYESDLVSQQDVLLADVELAKLERRAIELVRQRRIAVARINTLLLRLPESPLPRPPAWSDALPPLPAVELLQVLAAQQRPDLAARQSRIRAAQASLGLAQREYYPDLEVSGAYNTMWQGEDQPMQGQVGLSLNVPLARGRRAGAVRESAAMVSQNRAEWQSLSLEIQQEVQEAYERLRESHGVLALYRDRILPAAEQSVESAVAGYVSGRLDFLRLIEAERELISLREERVMAELDFRSRTSELERAIAGPVPDGSAEEIPAGPPVPSMPSK